MKFLNINNFSPTVYFFLGALWVWFASYATIWQGYPSPISPLSLIIALPALSVPHPYLLGPLVGPIIYISWCFPLVNGQMKVPLRSKIFSVLFILLSVFFLVAGWKYGTQYEGVVHTITMYVFNIIFWVGLFFTERKNREKPTFRTNLSFHVLLFFWLTWVGFPWLGELP